MDEPIRTTWINYYTSSDKCPCCEAESENIANHSQKGHRRSNGVHLEWSLAYCEACCKSEEGEAHWKKSWAEKWAESERQAEENYQKYGVYTNVASGAGPSFYFGYTKVEYELGIITYKPYLEVYPDCPRNALNVQLRRCTCMKDLEEARQNAQLVVSESTVDDKYKQTALADAICLIDQLEKYREEDARKE